MISKHRSILYAVPLLFLIIVNQTIAQSWTQLSPNADPIYGFPTARTLFSGVYDTTNNLMMIFGGSPEDNFTYLNDVWVLSTVNGLGTSAWKQLKPNPDTTYGYPSTRGSHSAVYDASHNCMIIFGGYNGVLMNDVWVLSTANGLGGTPSWTQLFPTGVLPVIRRSHSAVYDTANNRMIIFGGFNHFSERVNELWVLSTANGLGGTPGWTQLSPNPDTNQTTNGYGGLPPTRDDHTAVYDTTNNRMIIFGGEGGGTGFLNDVWVLSTANGIGGTPTWSQLTPTGGPPVSRLGQTAIYDATNNRMTIFGGKDSNNPTYRNDIWVLSHANGLGGTPAWSQITTTGSTPIPRMDLAAVYDAINDRMTIFAGFNNQILNPPYLNDVWILTNATVPVELSEFEATKE